MRSRGRKGVVIICSLMLFVLCSSCTEDQHFAANSEVMAKFRLRSESAMKGKLVIDEAYLKLDRIHVNGSSGGKNIANVTHTIPAEEPPYHLNAGDSSNVVFKLPTTAYEQLDFSLFLYRDNYQLIFQTPQQEPPVQGGNGGNPDPVSQPPGGDDGAQDEDDEEGSSGNEVPAGDSDEDSDEDDDSGNEGSGDDDDDENDGDDEENEEGNTGDDKKKNDNKNKDNDDKNKDDDKGDDDEKDGDNDDKDDDDDDDRQSGNNNGVIDLQHFFQNAKPALVLFGTYYYNNQPIKVIFAVTSLEKITVRATQDDSYNVILTLRNFADISFDPELMFSSVSSTDIESAAIQTYQGQQVLFIHKDHNASLYESLLSRLEASTTIRFLAPTTP